jgi:hypothetical protein
MIAALAAPLAVHAQSGASYYVKADGNDGNDGLSEARPFRNLAIALSAAQKGTIKTITVIGTLNEGSETLSFALKQQFGSVFALMDFSEGRNTAEITITGKPDASGAERAVLSAAGSGAGVLSITNGVKVRLQHIEISGGEIAAGDKNGEGITLLGAGTRLTLGPGAVVRGNQKYGVGVSGNTSCILDGGEIRDNSAVGVVVARGSFIMRSGSISNNRSPGSGGGVGVAAGGVFTMSGGSISGNSAGISGGGVAALSGGTFNQTGGTITENTARQGSPNVVRAKGALGTDLVLSASPAPSRSSSSSSSNASGSSSSSSGNRRGGFSGPEFAYDWGFFFETGNNRLFTDAHIPALNGGDSWFLNTGTFGLGFQLGVGFVAGIPMNILGEAGINIHYPGYGGFHLGASGEFYPFEVFGFSFGGGAKWATMSRNRLPEEWGDISKAFSYIRLGLLHKSSRLRREQYNNISLYFDFLPGNGWGIGFSWF